MSHTHSTPHTTQTNLAIAIPYPDSIPSEEMEETGSFQAVKGGPVMEFCTIAFFVHTLARLADSTVPNGDQVRRCVDGARIKFDTCMCSLPRSVHYWIGCRDTRNLESLSASEETRWCKGWLKPCRFTSRPRRMDPCQTLGFVGRFPNSRWPGRGSYLEWR